MAMVLPVASLTLVIGGTVQQVRPFFSHHRAGPGLHSHGAQQGCLSVRLMYKHLLRNALSPIVTLLGVSLPWLIGGEIVVESVFNYPGMGLPSCGRRANSHDYPLLMGITLVVGAATVVGSLLAMCFTPSSTREYVMASRRGPTRGRSSRSPVGKRPGPPARG